MKRILSNLIVLGALCAPSISFSQSNPLFSQNNRILIQTGLFHSFFDGSSITSTPIPKKYPDFDFNRRLNSLFGGFFNDSKGIQYQRLLNSKSSISAEYMVLNAAYNYEEVYNDPSVTPILFSRNIRYLNISYSRNVYLSEQFKFVYGCGLNYLWGHERIYHYTYLNGWGEPRYYGYDRNDFGLNVRTGLEFTPLKWLTFSTSFDFIGIVILGAKDINGNNAKEFYEEKFGLSTIPSQYDLSWRFAVGFNF